MRLHIRQKQEKEFSTSQKVAGNKDTSPARRGGKGKRMIEQLNQILQGICNWIAARNKVLWSGDKTTGSITVSGIDDYDVISVEINSYWCSVIMKKISTEVISE